VLGLFSTDAAVARERYRRFLADGLAANAPPPSTGSDPDDPARATPARKSPV
jgi:hypothetical protein